MPKKTIVYVDALNLFNGAIKPSRNFADRLPRKFRWLDIGALLMKTLSSHDCEIVGIKYFSALVKGEDNAAHDAYIRALRRHNPPGSPPLVVCLGEMEARDTQGRSPLKFKNEKGRWIKSDDIAAGAEISIVSFRERQTDINLASQMVADAVLGRCECVALVSIDRDFLGALRRIKEETNSGRTGLSPVDILLISPRSREPGKIWDDVISDFVCINAAHILDSRLPDVAGGVHCPSIWRD